jgi:putative transposase
MRDRRRCALPHHARAISEELCGHRFSASAMSEINKKLDEELGRFALRELDRP